MMILGNFGTVNGIAMPWQGYSETVHVFVILDGLKNSLNK